MTDDVKAALQTLRDNAEHDFERHWIDQLEQDIANPPQVEVIDEKRQRFRNKIYHRASPGYYNISRNLHVEVWEYYNGEIPEGCHIHHGQDGRECNNVQNLSLQTQHDHAKFHFDKIREELSQIKRVCQNCGKSFTPVQSNQRYCGRKCQSEYHNRKHTPKKVRRICEFCGKEFLTNDRCNFTTKTCSHECAGKLARQKAPVDTRARDDKGRFK